MNKSKCLNISMNGENHVIVIGGDVTLNFGVLLSTIVGVYGTDFDLFKQLNVFYKNLYSVNRYAHDQILESYTDIHNEISKYSPSNKKINDIVSNITNYHTFAFSNVNLLNQDDIKYYLPFYSLTDPHCTISLISYLSLVEKSIFLKSLLPLISLCCNSCHTDEKKEEIENVICKAMSENYVDSDGMINNIGLSIAMVLSDGNICSDDDNYDNLFENIEKYSLTRILPFINLDTSNEEEFILNSYIEYIYNYAEDELGVGCNFFQKMMT